MRPGHTDLVKYHKSQGYVDIRGGGRSSYRSTISDVIGGAIARIFLKEHFDTVILSSISQVGPLRTNLSLAQHFGNVASRQQDAQPITREQIAAVEARLDEAEIHSLDAEFAQEAGELIKRTRIEGDSLGAAVEVVAVNPPSLAGEPLYQSLKVRLMGVLGGLNAVQSCEVGDGVQVISRKGSENNDPIRRSGYQANSHGGLIGWNDDRFSAGLPGRIQARPQRFSKRSSLFVKTWRKSTLRWGRGATTHVWACVPV